MFHFSFNQKMTLAHQQMNSDYEKLKQEDAEKSAKLQDLMYVFSVFLTFCFIIYSLKNVYLFLIAALQTNVVNKHEKI